MQAQDIKTVLAAFYNNKLCNLITLYPKACVSYGLNTILARWSVESEKRVSLSGKTLIL